MLAWFIWRKVLSGFAFLIFIVVWGRVLFHGLGRHKNVGGRACRHKEIPCYLFC